MIVVTVEGGIVQGISSDDPCLVGKAVVVIDYDVEGAGPEKVEQVPQTGGATETAVIGRREVDVLCAPVAKYLKGLLISRKGRRTGSRSIYERGDKVKTALGIGVIENDPDEHGACMVVLDRLLDDGTKRFATTTFQFHGLIRKWNSKATKRKTR